MALAGTGDGQVLFCNLGPIRVRDVLCSGNNGPLPTTVVVRGLDVPVAGTYGIRSVRLSSNGDIELVVDDRTSIVPAVAPAPAAMHQIVALVTQPLRWPADRHERLAVSSGEGRGGGEHE